MKKFLNISITICSGLLLIACVNKTKQPVAPLQLSELQQIEMDLRNQDVQVIQRGDTLRLILPSDKFFEPQSATLRDNRKPTLLLIATLLKHRNKYAVVNGNTDDLDSIKNQQKQSTDQAESITAFLWAQGIPKKQLAFIGHGSRQPVASNAIANGQAANRRIEIISH